MCSNGFRLHGPFRVLFNEEPEVRDDPAIVKPVESLRVKLSSELEFAYPDGTQALKNIDIKLEAGKPWRLSAGLAAEDYFSICLRT